MIAVLFPRKDDLSAIERIALSFGLSIAVVPLLGLALNYTPFGIRLSPILTVLSVFTVSLALGAYIRRSMVPEGDKFSVDFAALFKKMKGSFKATNTKIDRLLTIILIISIILAISMTIYVIATPKEGEKFTEFYILGPGGKASDYPTNLKVGEEGEVIIGIVNHEYAQVIYQLEVRLDGTVIGEEHIALEHNETWEHHFSFTFTLLSGLSATILPSLFPFLSSSAILNLPHAGCSSFIATTRSARSSGTVLSFLGLLLLGSFNPSSPFSLYIWDTRDRRCSGLLSQPLPPYLHSPFVNIPQSSISVVGK